jgi:hypothetical protein
MSKVSEILRNNPKNHFGSNSCFTTLLPRNSSFRPRRKFCIFYVSKVSEIQWRCFTSLVTRNSAFRLGRKECIFYLLKVLRNDPKHSRKSIVSNGVEWTLHNFSTLKHYIQFPSKVSEILRNNPRNHFGSNTCFTTLLPRNSLFRLGRKFCIFYVSKVSEILRNTPKHHLGSNGVEGMLHNFGTPKQCIQPRKTSSASFYLSKVSEILRNTTKHHFGSNGDVSQLW